METLPSSIQTFIDKANFVKGLACSTGLEFVIVYVTVTLFRITKHIRAYGSLRNNDMN